MSFNTDSSAICHYASIIGNILIWSLLVTGLLFAKLIELCLDHTTSYSRVQPRHVNLVHNKAVKGLIRVIILLFSCSGNQVLNLIPRQVVGVTLSLPSQIPLGDAVMARYLALFSALSYSSGQVWH